MAYEFVDFVVTEASRDTWDRYHVFRRIRHAVERPDDPVRSDEATELDLKYVSPFNEVRRVLVVDGEEVVGYCVASRHTPASPDYEENKHIMRTYAEILPSHQRKGIGIEWASRVKQIAAGWDKSLVTIWTEEESGNAFLTKIGAEPKLFENENRLDLGALDWDLVDRWIEEGAKRSPGSKLEFHDTRFPAVLYDEYCPVYTEITNDMPLEELEMGAEVYTPERWVDVTKWLDQTGGSHHTFLVREEDGQISALSDILHNPDTETLVYQWATGVLRQYRGRGLGKWVKAAMLKFIRERYPEARFIVTYNAKSNAPMMAINNALGFKAYRQETAYQIKV
ncbi:MAG: GNAT family N-acetyltransferase [Actinomycetota bacterium]